MTAEAATEKTGTVYTLVDPRDNRVRYIGATTRSLKARLTGHLTSPTPRIKAWVDEVVSGGFIPRIEPIKEGVPEGELWDLEHAEITQRLIAGEPLLNESGTARARRHLEQQHELALAERERAAWEHAANQVRGAIGGPLAPGGIPAIPFSRRSVQAYNDLFQARAGLNAGVSPPYMQQDRCERAQEKAEKALWLSAQGAWGRLRGRVRDLFESVLTSRVENVLNGRWTNLDEASRYLTLLPWEMVAVTPWAALAKRAGMDVSSGTFVDWVTDDPSVREALVILQNRPRDGRRPLSLLNHYDTRTSLSTGLVALTAAHLPGFDLPRTLRSDVKTFLESMLHDGQLSPPMAALLVELDPLALDRLLGPDITVGLDARLGLPAGAARDVLSAVLEMAGRPQRGDRLVRIVNRAKGVLPTVDAPDFSGWCGNDIPMFQTVIASLAAAGVLTPTPRRMTPAELVDEVRALWSADPDWLERAA